MNGEAVDAWVSSVDELLAGQRGDVLVSGDAMRWMPQEPETGPLLPAAMWDACVRPSPDYPQLTIRVDSGPALAAFQRLAEMVAEFGGAVRAELLRVAVGEACVSADSDPVDHCFRRALEARRNRDTGPTVDPYRWTRRRQRP